MKMMLVFENVKRNVVTILMLMMVAMVVNAVPAKPGLIRTLTLTDGTTVTAQLVGDEHGHYWLGQDGKAYQAVSGSNVYQLVNAEAVKQTASTRRNAVNKERMRRLAPRKIGSVGNYTGKKKGIIILVNFSDVAFNTSNATQFQHIVNDENYVEGNFKGSMHDYFYAQSEEKFDLTFDVVGPVTVSNTQSYYGGNDNSGNDQHPAEMIIEALQLADSEVNFADYDWDRDNYVDQVYVVYAGKGEADGGSDDTIWPHAWTLSSAKYYGDGTGAQTLDGVRINSYACGGELNGQTGALAGIGTMCHEFSHCLGYPDFYDTDYSGGQGMGYWDLMDSGSYNGDGYQPAGYTGWERWAAGWKEPIELTYTKAVTGMKALQNDGETYIIYNQGNTNEYYMLENRQKVGWDASLPGAGLLIVHVDYNASAWSGNTPNDTPSHQRMTWIPADNKYQYTTYQGTKYYSFDGMANDPFPYGSVNAFNKNTTPAAKFFNANNDGTYYLDSSVEDITQNADGTISFNFKGINNVASPVFSPAAGRYADAQTVTISCDTEGATIYYTTDNTTPSATNGTPYSSPITVSETTTLKAIAILDSEESEVATAKYVIGASTSNPNTKNFKLVTSTDDLESGMRYIIACGSKKTAAGALSSNILSSKSVTVNDDIITIDDNVAVFVLEETNDGWTFENEDTNEFLYATTTKKLAYNSTANAWTLADGTDGVIMSYGSYGTMLYNVSSPRFTTYTSDPSTSMIQANLYMEYSENTPQKDDITMSFSPTEVELTWGDEFTEPTLTIEPEGAEINVTYSSSNTSVATVDASTGEVTIIGTGTTTITATFDGNETYNNASASYTLTVNAAPIEPDADRYELVTDVSTLEAGDKILIAYINGDIKKVMSTTQNTNNRAASVDFSINDDNTLTPGSTAQVITLEKTGTNYLFNVGNGYLYAASSDKNYLRTETTADANAKADITIDATSGDATIVFQGSNTNNHLRYNTTSVLFSCYWYASTVIAKPQIYRKVKAETITATIGATGYATLYYGDKNLTVPEGVEAYTYSINNGKLEESWLYEAGEVIPKSTAVVLVGEQGDYEFTVTTTDGDVDDDNLLMGFDEDAQTVGPDGSTEGYKFYMLSLDKNSTPGSVGFYFNKGCPQGQPFLSKAHKAYLPVPVEAAGSKSFFLFNEMEETTAIESPMFKDHSSQIYNLNGQRVSTPQRGIYIVNGKKVVVK